MRACGFLCFVATLVVSSSVCAIGSDNRFAEDVDPNKDIGNIHRSGRLKPTKTHPYAGLWKAQCTDDVGLAIAEAGSTLYTVSFCSATSCFKPGTYRPNTYLINDENYRIESPTRMLIRDVGPEFKPYVRCWPTP